MSYYIQKAMSDNMTLYNNGTITMLCINLDFPIIYSFFIIALSIPTLDKCYNRLGSSMLFSRLHFFITPLIDKTKFLIQPNSCFMK